MMLNLLDRKINNGWIFLQEKCILRETLDVQNNEWRQFCYFETLHKTILVCFVLLFRDPIEFG